MADTQRQRQAIRPDERLAYQRARLVQQVLEELGVVTRLTPPSDRAAYPQVKTGVV